MDDKHIAILVRNYRHQLQDALERVRDAIPDNAPRHEVKNIFGEVTFTDYVALEPLYTLISRIDEDIATLEDKREEDTNGE